MVRRAYYFGLMKFLRDKLNSELCPIIEGAMIGQSYCELMNVRHYGEPLHQEGGWSYEG